MTEADIDIADISHSLLFLLLFRMNLVSDGISILAVFTINSYISLDDSFLDSYYWQGETCGLLSNSNGFNTWSRTCRSILSHFYPLLPFMSGCTFTCLHSCSRPPSLLTSGLMWTPGRLPSSPGCIDLMQMTDVGLLPPEASLWTIPHVSQYTNWGFFNLNMHAFLFPAHSFSSCLFLNITAVLRKANIAGRYVATTARLSEFTFIEISFLHLYLQLSRAELHGFSFRESEINKNERVNKQTCVNSNKKVAKRIQHLKVWKLKRELRRVNSKLI